MDPHDLIDNILDVIRYVEATQDTQGLGRAKWLLNNDLRYLIDVYIQDEVEKAVSGFPIDRGKPADSRPLVK